MIRIVIADDHPIVRAGLQQIISKVDDMEVVAEAISGQALLTVLEQNNPDVLLCDMSMPGVSGVELIKLLKRTWPQLPILVLSVHEDQTYALRTIKAGAMGYLTKAYPSQHLIAAIRRVAGGRLYIHEDMAEALARQTINIEEGIHVCLSDREREVFIMLAEGLTVTGIAKQLHLSVKTVSTHKTHIMQKMSFTSMTDLIRYALDNGLMSRF